MTAPTLSLVIATYNRGPRIAATLESVAAQSVLPTEVVVVDDCSPDGTGDWVNAHYPAVRVVRPPRNGGTSAARNFGATTATGEVLMFLDHDDELLPNAVETLLAVLAEFPEAAAAFADHAYVNTVTGVEFPDHHQTQPAFHRMQPIPVVRQTAAGRLYGYAMYRALLWGNLLQQPWAVRRLAFQQSGGFDPAIRLCEDWDLYLRITRAGPIAITDRVISNHIIEGENLHLRPGQEAMHERVIRKRLWAEWAADPQAAWVLTQRLGMHLKMAGDQVYARNPGSAWRLYLRSFARWPFDYVVAARTFVVWPLARLRGRRATAKITREPRS